MSALVDLELHDIFERIESLDTFKNSSERTPLAAKQVGF